MHRRALLLAGLATLPAPALPWSLSAQRGTSREHTSTELAARRQQRDGLTASDVRTRILTRTFTSRVPLTIPAGGPASVYPSTIPVRGFTQGRILNVRVTLIGLSHSAPKDLDIMVVAPGNVGVILMSDAGAGAGYGDDVNGITLVFDQRAPDVLPDTLFSGTFQPLNAPPAVDLYEAPAPARVTGHSLTRFNNRNPNGTWRLFVTDEFSPDAGSLAGWSLRIQARVRVPHQHRTRRRR